MTLSNDLLLKISENWGLDFRKVRTDIDIAGSPERILSRYVVEDSSGQLYLLEKIPPDKLKNKLRIIRTLEFLKKKGTEFISSYIPCKSGKHISICNFEEWQLCPFVQGIQLDRPGYAFEGWRGREMADFLLDLRKNSEGISLWDKTDVFSIKKYIRKLHKDIKQNAPQYEPRFSPVIDFLEKKFMKKHDRLPVCFCHGDYHPLNIIWGKNRILSVIDWEFAGFKPETYDMANLMGCVGMEDPRSLTGDLACEFIQRIKKSGLISQSGWDCLIEFMIAIRFGWLSEWLRKSDTEMIRLEEVYMTLLMNNIDSLKNQWGLAGT